MVAALEEVLGPERTRHVLRRNLELFGLTGFTLERARNAMTVLKLMLGPRDAEHVAFTTPELLRIDGQDLQATMEALERALGPAKAHRAVMQDGVLLAYPAEKVHQVLGV